MEFGTISYGSAPSGSGILCVEAVISLRPRRSFAQLSIALFAIAVALEGCNLQASPSDPSDSPVIVDRDIVSPASWSSKRVYVITRNLTVSATLTISPGTVVKLEPGAMINLGTGGTLIVGSASGSPVVFTSYKDDAHGGDTNRDGNATSPAPGDWGGISTNGNGGSVFNNAEFLYGGARNVTMAALNISGGSDYTSVENCVFADNDGYPPPYGVGALDAGGAGPHTTITGNTFYGNVTPLSIDANISLDNSNVFHGTGGASGGGTVDNRYQAIAVRGANGIDVNTNWSENEVAVVITDYLSVNSGGVLALGADVVLKQLANVEIDISAGGDLQWSSSDAFTSYRDDTRLGDTNGDGGQTAPAAGDWVGIYDYNSGANTWVSSPAIYYAAN